MAERFGPLDFDQFHTEEVPRLLADFDGAAQFRAESRLRPLAFRLTDGRAYTFIPKPPGMQIEPGTDRAATVVVLTPEDWLDFVWELRSAFALLYAARIEIERGSFGQLAHWEPALRGVFAGQPVYDLSDPLPVLNADGGPLELDQSFTLADSDDEVRDFLDRAGFVHLRAVFTAEELDRLRAKPSVPWPRPVRTTTGRGGQRWTGVKFATGSTT